MNKKEERWRNEGALYALRVAKEKGIDELEKDLKRRGILGISLLMPYKEIKQMTEDVAEKVICSVKTIAMWTLYEQGWRKVRLKRFEEQMDKMALECMDMDKYGNSYVTLQDMQKEMFEKCGVCNTIQELDQIAEENRNERGRYIRMDLVTEVLREAGLESVAESLEEKVKNSHY